MRAGNAPQKGGTAHSAVVLDTLLPQRKGPELTEDQERDLLAMFEAKFAEMTTPGSKWDVTPHSPRDIGLRLASYYQRKGETEERTRVLRAVAEAFVRRAKMGDPLMGLLFLHDARRYYLEAGLRDEAERVQHEAQRIGPEAEKRLVPMTVKHEIPQPEVGKVLDAMMEGGMEHALLRLTRYFIPDQIEIARDVKEVEENHPLYAMFCGKPKILGHGHIEADMADDTGDPDGRMVHETARHIQLQAHWIAWALDRMIRDGLTAARVVDFARPCALFAEDRLPLIRRGVEAHFMGDYVQAIHILIPQIERALLNLLPLTARPSNKAHRTGQGVMQFKNLNDILSKAEWPVPGDGGENLRLYLLAALAHPKGLNIRNDLCHGLLSAADFTRARSELVLHVLLAVSLLCRAKEGQEEDAETTP